VVTSPEAEAEVGRAGDLLPRPKLRPRPGSGVAMTPLEAEAGVGRGGAPLLRLRLNSGEAVTYCC
jgi:hypothetical protein